MSADPNPTPEPVVPAGHESVSSFINYLVARDAQSAEEPILYRLTFESGIGVVVWEKTAEELLQPNGSEPLLAWMLRESDRQGYQTFRLERIV